MRKKLFVIIAILSVFVVGTGLSLAADVAKIGVVDFQRFIEESNLGQAAQATIESKGGKMESKMRELRTQIEEIKKSLERDAMVMGREAIDERQRSYTIKKMDFENLSNKYVRSIKKLEIQLIADVRNSFLSLAEELGKKGGYLLVMEKQGVVYYHPSAIDVTDKLIEMSNSKPKTQ